MQNVHFKHVDDLLDWLPEEELAMVLMLRQEIFECIPWAKEKLSFQVPFYAGQKTICFIWPGSVWWGGKKNFDGVQLGFAQGHLLTNLSNYFEVAQRKQVITKVFQNPNEIDLQLVRSFLFEAALVDQQPNL